MANRNFFFMITYEDAHIMLKLAQTHHPNHGSEGC
jgi:hypothetical protein